MELVKLYKVGGLNSPYWKDSEGKRYLAIDEGSVVRDGEEVAVGKVLSKARGVTRVTLLANNGLPLFEVVNSWGKTTSLLKYLVYIKYNTLGYKGSSLPF